MIKKLKEAGVNIKEDEEGLLYMPLAGKTLVFTGGLEFLSRRQAEDLARKAGGSPASAVSKNTDFLVAGKNPGSKYDQALKSGVKIISEAEFSRLIIPL